MDLVQQAPLAQPVALVRQAPLVVQLLVVARPLVVQLLVVARPLLDPRHQWWLV